MLEGTPTRHSDRRYGYRGFDIVVFEGKPAVALVSDPLAPERGFEPMVRKRPEDAVLAAARMIDTYCRDEAAVTAARLMG